MANILLGPFGVKGQLPVTSNCPPSGLSDSGAVLSCTAALSSKWIGTFALLAALFFGFAPAAQASHYRYGSISWVPAAGNTIQFRVTVSFRTSAEFASTPNVGDSFSDPYFYFGDGASVQPTFTLTSVNATEDYFFAEAIVTHTYTSPGNFTAYVSDCCRLSTLQNNANGSYYFSTVANVGTGNRSPVSTLPPIINLTAGQAAATFQVPASDPDGSPLTFSLATPGDLGGIGFTQPAGLAISSSGQVTFNTIGKNPGDLFSSVLKISDGSTYINLDFVIRIVADVGNPPVFVYGGITPANGSTIQGTVGTPITFTVQATDPDAGNTVNIQATGLPAGSTFPSVTGNGSASGSFTFTPTAGGTSVISFLATDNLGNQTLTSVTLQIQACAPFTPMLTASNGGVITCSNRTLTLTSGGGNSYTFTGPGLNQTGSSSTATVSQAGTYTVNVTTSAGCSSSATTSISSNTVAPTATLTNNGPFSDNNQTVTLTAGTGSGNTYAFSTGAAQQGGAGGNTATVTTAGSYSVTVTGSNGCTATASTLVTGAANTGTCRNGTAVIRVVVLGSPVKYDWYRNSITSNRLTESTNNQRGTATTSLTLVNQQLTASYYVRVTDANGSAIVYGPFKVTVDPTCNAYGRVAVQEMELKITVLGNPLPGESLRATVGGAEGKALNLQLLDLSGRPIRQQVWQQAEANQPVEWNLTGQASGVYLLQAATDADQNSPAQRHSLKVVKP